MKKLILLFLFLFLIVGYASALEVTDNTDKDNFLYKVQNVFATDNLAASLTATAIGTNSEASLSNAEYYYTVTRDARIVGIGIAGNAACTAGGATFDITVNGAVTGVQTVIEAVAKTAGYAQSGTTYAYARQDRADVSSYKGLQNVRSATFHSVDSPWGRSTPLVAGDRIGVKVTTNSAFAPTTTDYVVSVYVIE